MKIEKVSNNKIKVTVTQDDMERWGVSFESFAGDSPEAQDLFWTLIKRAEFETGFEVENSRLVIEALPHKNDGIVLFVTRIDDGFDFDKTRIRPGRPRYKVKRSAMRDEDEVLVYMFADFDDLCAFARQWRFIGEKSNLYSYNGKYFVSLRFDKRFYNEEYVRAKISEYARRIASPHVGEAFLREHGTVISEGDAVLTVARYFDE